jgi:hypothetical protein
MEGVDAPVKLTQKFREGSRQGPHLGMRPNMKYFKICNMNAKHEQNISGFTVLKSSL